MFIYADANPFSGIFIRWNLSGSKPPLGFGQSIVEFSAEMLTEIKIYFNILHL